MAREEGVVPVTRLEDENDALKKENEQLRRELARVTAGGEERTSSGKRKRTEPIDRSTEKALPRLPTEVWAEVAAKIHRDDVMAFASTSKQLREVQQQAGRKLVTRPYKDYDKWSFTPVLTMDPVYFSRDWCAWWSKIFSSRGGCRTASAPASRRAFPSPAGSRSSRNMNQTNNECMRFVIKVAAYHGYLDVLTKYWSDIPAGNPVMMDKYICKWAAHGGHLEALKLLRSKGCPWDGWTCVGAAKGGHFEVLKWLMSEGCPLNEDACIGAARGGHLEVLKWLGSMGCPLYVSTCTFAAKGGHFEVLKWLMSEGCPWDASAWYGAADGGHLEILKWLRSHGCPWNEKACAGAAEGGHLEVLKWLRSEGCPWNEKQCRRSAYCHPNIVRWIDSQSSYAGAGGSSRYSLKAAIARGRGARWRGTPRRPPPPPEDAPSSSSSSSSDAPRRMR